MLIVKTLEQLQLAISKARQSGRSIGLVPTMGNLHAGHIQLVKTAKQQADCVIVSLFVNPTQFGANEDLDSYPRSLENDISQLESAKTDILFTPTNQTIYPLGGENTSHVHVPQLTDLHCGAARPGHFDGVTTVVAKLFNMTGADIAVFGEKDYQQLAVIRRMVADLNMMVKIIGEPIVRQSDGLAMSSRNGYLSAQQMALAPQLQKALKTIRQKILAGDRAYSIIESDAKDALSQHGFKVDYLNICQQDTLQAATAKDNQLVVLAAAFIGNTRLIDNTTLSLF